MAVRNLSDYPPLMKVPDFMEFAEISRVTAYNTIAMEGFPSIRFGRVIRIPRDALAKWLNVQAGME